jgi:hypothetical protein
MHMTSTAALQSSALQLQCAYIHEHCSCSVHTYMSTAVTMCIHTSSPCTHHHATSSNTWWWLAAVVAAAMYKASSSMVPYPPCTQEEQQPIVVVHKLSTVSPASAVVHHNTYMLLCIPQHASHHCHNMQCECVPHLTHMNHGSHAMHLPCQQP